MSLTQPKNWCAIHLHKQPPKLQTSIITLRITFNPRNTPPIAFYNYGNNLTQPQIVITHTFGNIEQSIYIFPQFKRRDLINILVKHCHNTNLPNILVNHCQIQCKLPYKIELQT